jgi:signal transduction histidine kinase
LRLRRLVSPADLLLSAGVFALFLPYVDRQHQVYPVLTLAALNAGALLGRKRFPLLTLGVCLVIAGMLAVLMKRSYPVSPANLVALYAVGRYCTRGVAIGAAVVTVVIGVVVAALSGSIPTYGPHNLPQLGWVVAAVLAGSWVRIQRFVIGAEERADRAEREREEEARRRVAEERVHIARELHDIVGHALMSISVLSSVSARLIDGNPGAGRDALRTISGVSNSALREIRSTLSLLRGSAEPLKWPERGLDDLAQLVDQAKRSGLPIRLLESGEHADVPAIVGFTVYRIVQESLTNVARHARDVTDVTVRLAYSPDHLDVTIANDGAPAANAPGPGIGIQGMRERAAATGGRLDITAPLSGGFRVQARLPLKEAP